MLVKGDWATISTMITGKRLQEGDLGLVIAVDCRLLLPLANPQVFSLVVAL